MPYDPGIQVLETPVPRVVKERERYLVVAHIIVQAKPVDIGLLQAIYLKGQRPHRTIQAQNNLMQHLRELVEREGDQPEGDPVAVRPGNLGPGRGRVSSLQTVRPRCDNPVYWVWLCGGAGNSHKPHHLTSYDIEEPIGRIVRILELEMRLVYDQHPCNGDNSRVDSRILIWRTPATILPHTHCC